MKLWALFKEEFAPKADGDDSDDDAKARACLIALSLSVAASGGFPAHRPRPPRR